MLKVDELVKSLKIVMPVPDQVRDDGSGIQNELKSLDSGFRDCVVIQKRGRLLLVMPVPDRVRDDGIRHPETEPLETALDSGSGPE